MDKIIAVICLILISLWLYPSCTTSEPSISDSPWNTFVGSSAFDAGFCIAVDRAGNSYISGYSDGTWGSPLRASSGDIDMFLAKFDGAGRLLWNTFFGPVGSSGSAQFDKNLVLDRQGNAYVTGTSVESWGFPIHPKTTGFDTFVAKFGRDGALIWNTFLGSSDALTGHGIALDTQGRILVSGCTFVQSWGSPVRPFSGYIDAFVAKLDSRGHLIWNTFLGSEATDHVQGIAADDHDSVYVIGTSLRSWGMPVRPHSDQEDYDAFVAMLSGEGDLIWNTFLGSGGGSNDTGYAIAVAAGGSSVTGTSLDSWGSPIGAFQGSMDAFVARLDDQGRLVWHTFLGSPSFDQVRDICLDSLGHVFVIGTSLVNGWGPGANEHAGLDDAYIAELDDGGSLLWTTFLGSAGDDSGLGIALDGHDNICAVGMSDFAWGFPINPHTDGQNRDAFIAKLTHR